MREALSGGWNASLHQIRSAADSAASRNSVSCQSASLHNKIDGVCSFICIIFLFFLCVFLIFIVFFALLLVELYNIFYSFTIAHAKKALQIYGKIYPTISGALSYFLFRHPCFESLSETHKKHPKCTAYAVSFQVFPLILVFSYLFLFSSPNRFRTPGPAKKICQHNAIGKFCAVF